jgi:hypothetical protein
MKEGFQRFGLFRLSSGRYAWHERFEFCQLPEVLGGGYEGEFVLDAAWPSQSEASKSEYALEVCKQHFDLLSSFLRGRLNSEPTQRRAKSRTISYFSRVMARTSVFGQPLAFEGQFRQSVFTARYFCAFSTGAVRQ